jgi:hypothetical protein
VSSYRSAAIKHDAQKAAKKIPKFAQTEAQADAELDLECDDLLDFMDGLDPERFMEDLDFKMQLATLKKKVDDLQHDPDFMERVNKDLAKRQVASEKNHKYRQELRAARGHGQDDDMITRTDGGRGGLGEANSVASGRTQGNVFVGKNFIMGNRKHSSPEGQSC